MLTKKENASGEKQRCCLLGAMVAFKSGGRDWPKYRSPGVGGDAELHLGSGEGGCHLSSGG